MRWLYGMLKFILIVLSGVWVSLFIYTHEPFAKVVSYALITVWSLFTLLILLKWLSPKWLPKFFKPFFTLKNLTLGFIGIFCVALAVFFSLTPINNREWKPEVAQMLDFDLANDGKTITLYNVRNFDWQSKTVYTEHWETRQYDLDKLQSLDLIASYWMGDSIAHTLVSFGFTDGKRVAFSIEIRKENNEDFSTFGGFFREFELIIIAADEKDIIYTRSNARHEDVYIYPLILEKSQLKPLFLAYVSKAIALKSEPTWYNSLTQNCTTAMYPLLQAVTPMPWDYRWIVSGYFPEYLYDQRKISHQFDFATWQNKAHINPKSYKFSGQNPISSTDYSALIRQDF